MEKVRCYDNRRCFAKNGMYCTILNKGYKDKPCPFCKPKRDVTDGKFYPVKENN